MTDVQAGAPITRFHCVDALRGIAALAIVVFHYHHFYLADAFGRPSIPPVHTFPFAFVLAPVFGPLAAKAVELFWLISGFVFTHVYLARQSSAWEFGVARFARLYPLHFVMLIYVAVLQIVSFQSVGHWQVYGNNDLRHFALQLFMASNWITWARGLSFNGPIWSVSFEIVVYAIFFVSLYFLRWAPRLGALILCVAFWSWVAFEPVRVPLIQAGVFECAGYFYLGSLLCSLQPDASMGRAAAFALIGACAALAGFRVDSDLVTTAGVAVALVSLAAGLDRSAPILAARLGPVGDISYSLYLVHVPLQMTALLVADVFFAGSREFANSYLALPIYILTSVLVAVAAHRWLERPVGLSIRRIMLQRKNSL